MASKLAAQMYTIRDFVATGAQLAQALEKLRDIGYPAVQMSAVGAISGEAPEVSAGEARKMLDANGIKCIATHRPWADLMSNTEAEIEFHQTIGCDYAAVGGVSTEYGHTPEGYRRFLDDARPVIAQLKAAGISFGHHNHSHEFVRSRRHGPYLEDILIDEGAPDLMLELDLYWVEHAGLNCVRVLERCRGRVPVIHVKDKEVVPDEGPVMAPIGEGNMDWDHIIPACEEAGVQWYAVEQDVCRRDPFDCLKSSFEYLTAKGI